MVAGEAKEGYRIGVRKKKGGGGRDLVMIIRCLGRACMHHSD